MTVQAVGNGGNALAQKIFRLRILVNIGDMGVQVDETRGNYQTLRVNDSLAWLWNEPIIQRCDSLSTYSDTAPIGPSAGAIDDGGILNQDPRSG